MPSVPAPRVSVVIPAWNRRGTLRMSVESVLRQTFTDFELIVVDDGSTDGTMEAIADLADPRIRRLAHETNKGVSAARNTGIRAARGEWVAFQDSDDEWLPLKLEKQMARLEGAGPEVVACHGGLINLVFTTSQHARTSLIYTPLESHRKLAGNLHDELLAGHFVTPQTLIARRGNLLSFGGFDESLGVFEDWDCSFQLAQCGKFIFVDEPLAIWRGSANSITNNRSKFPDSRLRFLEKHRAAISLAPHHMAKHYIITSGEQRRTGDLPGARASLAKARKLQPFSPGIWLRSLRLWGLMLWRTIYRI